MDTLRVLAKAGVLVLDYAYAAAHGRRRFVGRTAVSSENLDELPDGHPTITFDATEYTGASVMHEAWVARSEPTAVSNIGVVGSYFRARVREGGLWAADAQSAAECCVQFDHNYGGDYAAKAGE